MSNAIAIRESEELNQWQVIREQATILVKSGFLPSSVKTPEQALAIILTGKELGIGQMSALNNINVIAGKPTVSPQLMLALINRTGQLEDMLITDDGQCCSVTMRRKGRQPHSESFSMKDAALMKTTEGYGDSKKTISLSEKYNWKQMPAVMRKWRAVAACARVVFPDVILGLYTPDEMGAHVDEEGQVIDIQAEPVVEPETIIEEEPAPQVELTPADELISLSRSLGYDEGALTRWLTKNHHLNPGLTLREALACLGDGEIRKAKERFDKHAKALNQGVKESA